MADLLLNEGHLMESTLAPQKIAENQERAEFQEALPYIEHLIDWFDKQADECDRISTLDSESKVAIEVQVEARKLLATLLRSKKGEIQAFLSTYAPKYAKALEDSATTTHAK